MERQQVTIPLAGDETISAILTLPAKERKGLGVITAHGSGNDMENPILVAFTDGLAEAGYPTLRFNFSYMEKGRKTPDRPEKLENAWAAAYQWFREDSGAGVTRIIAAGKSMGGRIASQMVAGKKLPAEGLILLGYPCIRRATCQDSEMPTCPGSKFRCSFLPGRGIACATWQHCKRS